MSEARAIKIAVTAMGGQGGGVLANWIVQVGEQNGFIAQTTSVPGVAQRTGATIYYVELFPQEAAKAAGKEPVLALMPAPGDVDIVVAAELMEAGRAVKRGFVTKKTTLIASTHRDYAIAEKIGLGDGRQDGDRVLELARETAGVFVGADMATAAGEAGTVISAVLFGALAGSGALPIGRGRFEETIRQMGRAVEPNLRGFASGYEVAKENAAAAPDVIPPTRASAQTMAPSPTVAPLIARMQKDFPAPAHFYIREGLKRTVDFQDVRYANEYLDRLARVRLADETAGGDRRDFALTETVAKHLALWMTFEDTIRVADLKTRATRFSRFRDDVRAADKQIVEIREFMHPRVEEICDLLPTPLAKFVLNNGPLRAAMKAVLGGGRRVSTTKLRGFLPLYFLASLRFMRRSSYRYHVEQVRIADWLEMVLETVKTDYEFAVAIAKMQRLIKGYGDTHERGLRNFGVIAAAMPAIRATSDPAGALNRLIAAALKDEDGAALEKAIEALSTVREMAA